jgi:high frequency lysogenization protein
MIGPPNRDQVVALGGVFQACCLVDTLARTGNVQADALLVAMSSLLNQNPDNCESVFGDISKLTEGFEAMEKLIGAGKHKNLPNTLRYVLGVIFLERKVLNSKVVLDKIGAGIAQANIQANHFSPSHENVINNLADLYTNTISTFRFRIQVSGQSGYLQQADVANRVRCLLFAGIRAGILWQQMGGRRWHFVFYRKQILEQVRLLRSEAHTQ